MSSSKSSRAVVIAVATSLMLAGCATTGSTPNRPLTPQEVALREQAKNYNATVAEGAVLGALAGGLLVAAFGGDARDIAKGAAAGAAVGFVAGNYVADRKQKYATTEAAYDSMISDVQAENARLATFAETSRAIIAEDQRQLDLIDQQIAAGTLSVKDAKRQIATLDSNRDLLVKSLQGLKEKEKQLSDVRTEAKNLGSAEQQARMDAEIIQLRRQISALEGDINAFVERRKVSRVG